jgi:GH15 family glucan-1,4-alpha-glucosidase
VYAALLAAAQFAQLLGKEESVRTYSAVAQRMREAMLEHLFDEHAGYFIKRIRAYDQVEDQRDMTLDMSSFFGPLYFGVIEPNDPRIERMFGEVERRLRVAGASEGYVRYEGDNYYTMHDAGSPNPWVVTTMWVAQYHLMRAEKPSDLARVYDMLEWTASHATEGGVLAEQMHPHTRAHMSTAPLVWSHAEFVLTVHAYLEKLERFNTPKTA